MIALLGAAALGGRGGARAAAHDGAGDGTGAASAALAPPQAAQWLAQRLPPLRASYPGQFAFGSALFPADGDFGAHWRGGPALRAWLAQAVAARRGDWLLLPPDWLAYAAEGERACAYLLTVRPRGAGSEVAALPLDCMEATGQRWRMLGRAGPGWYLGALDLPPQRALAAALLPRLGPGP